MLNVSKGRSILFVYSDAPVIFPVSKFTYVNGFECLEVRFELKIQRGNQRCKMAGPSRARCMEKNRNLMNLGAL